MYIPIGTMSLIKSFLATLKKRPGSKVNVVNASADELINRMEMEAEASPADVLITVDAGRLHRAKEKDLLQPIHFIGGAGSKYTTNPTRQGQLLVWHDL